MLFQYKYVPQSHSESAAVCPSSLVPEVLVCDVVLRADEDAGGTVVAAGDGDEHVAVLLQRLGVLAHHVVKAKIQLVEGQGLQCLEGMMQWK